VPGDGPDFSGPPARNNARVAAQPPSPVNGPGRASARPAIGGKRMRQDEGGDARSKSKQGRCTMGRGMLSAGRQSAALAKRYAGAFRRIGQKTQILHQKTA